MKKFKNYEEIEKFIDEECLETFEMFVLNEKINDFLEMAKNRLKKMDFQYLIVEHPHQMPKSIYIFQDYNDELLLRHTENFNKDTYLNYTDEELLAIALDLNDLNSYQIYSREDVLECDSLEEFIKKVYENQSYHNKFEKNNEEFVEMCEFFYNKVVDLENIGK